MPQFSLIYPRNLASVTRSQSRSKNCDHMGLFCLARSCPQCLSVQWWPNNLEHDVRCQRRESAQHQTVTVECPGPRAARHPCLVSGVVTSYYTTSLLRHHHRHVKRRVTQHQGDKLTRLSSVQAGSHGKCRHTTILNIYKSI